VNGSIPFWLAGAFRRAPHSRCVSRLADCRNFNISSVRCRLQRAAWRRRSAWPRNRDVRDGFPPPQESLRTPQRLASCLELAPSSSCGRHTDGREPTRKTWVTGGTRSRSALGVFLSSLSRSEPRCSHVPQTGVGTGPSSRAPLSLTQSSPSANVAGTTRSPAIPES
jgi:hypothetical protein